VAKQLDHMESLAGQDVVGQLGNVGCRVLFEEYDDIYLSMQPEKRRQSPPPVRKGKKKPRKRALHIGMSYTGWRHVGAGRYETVDKIAYASFGEAKPFLSKIQALQQQRYDMDGVQLRIVNGDGAKWIRGAADAGDAILQLDTYHRNKAVIKSVGDRETGGSPPLFF
jgi:hypothetical protein